MDRDCEDQAMTAALKLLPSVEEYLALERTASLKHEYHHGHIVAMPGGTHNHNAIKDNLVIEIGSRLKGGPCRSYSSDQRIQVSPTHYVYPDIVIVCDGATFAEIDRNSITNPRIIIEVLSDSTELSDRLKKFQQYAAIPGFTEYILVSQHEPVIERLFLVDDSWRFRVYSQLDATLEFTSVPIAIPLVDIYRDVTFAET
jgi:Uma2 family endonuclease